MENLSDKNITIVGLGLIGGSMAKAITKNLKVKNIWAVDTDENTLKLAMEEKVINCGYIDPKYPLENSDIVIICTYPDTTLKFIKSNVDYFKSNALITDTTGIKKSIVEKINNILREDTIFIGGHPMAGREVSGYKFSNEDIFKNSEYILSPTDNTCEKSLTMLTQLIKGIGFKKVTFMSPDIHDKKIAFTSQLPHVIACALINNTGLEEDTSGIGGSFKDMTRVANINSNLWCELISENKDNVLKEMNIFMEDLSNIYEVIEKNDKKELEKLFEKSSMRRKGIDDENTNC